MLLLDKPHGITTNRTLQTVKKIFKTEKAGHIGTLDPLATGLLPICFGEATKFSRFMLHADKSYYVEACLGIKTDTVDADGRIISKRPVAVATQQILAELLQIQRTTEQIPPMHSALKYLGKPLYFYARNNIEIPRTIRAVTIHELTLVTFQQDIIALHVSCSKSCYIRSIIYDLGEVLGCGAHIVALRRISIGDYTLKNSVTIEQLQEFASHEIYSVFCENQKVLDNTLLPVSATIAFLEGINLTRVEVLQALHGKELKIQSTISSGFVRLTTGRERKFIGVSLMQNETLLHKRLLTKEMVQQLLCDCEL